MKVADKEEEEETRSEEAYDLNFDQLFDSE